MTAPEPVDLAADPFAFGPPEQTVWKKYSPNLEFPISLLISTFFLTSLFAILVGLLFLSLGGGPEKTVPPMSLVDGGGDDGGEGSPGSGGNPQDTALKTPQQPATSGEETLKEQFDLPAIKEIQTAIALEDPSAEIPAVAPENANSLAKLDDALRDKLMGINQKGNPGAGKGDTNQPGTGPGGVGPDATRNRSLRWVMRFQTNGGRDYLDQLNALGAIVLVKAQQPGKMFIFRDLRSPQPGVVATDAELAGFSQQMQFCDSKRQSAEEVGKALNLSYTPDAFWAIFPKGIEEELAKLERAYRGRQAADVEQTIFAVSVVAGKYRLVVTEQTPRLGR